MARQNNKPKPPTRKPQENPEDFTPDELSQLDLPDPVKEAKELKRHAGKLATQIKGDIIRLAERTKSDLRTLLSRYVRCVSTQFNDHEDSELPRSLVRAVQNRHASATGGWGNVLLFHVGDAIVAWYNLSRGEHCDIEFASIERLHEIAADPGAYKVEGNDIEGYQLMTPAMIEARHKAKQDREDQEEPDELSVSDQQDETEPDDPDVSGGVGTDEVDQEVELPDSRD